MAGRPTSGSREGVTVSFSAKFAQSDQFRTVFREGMALVKSLGDAGLVGLITLGIIMWLFAGRQTA